MLKHCRNCMAWRASHHIFCYQCAFHLVKADKAATDNMALDEVATQVFHAAEYVKALEMCTVPWGYKEREAAFIKLTRAKATLAELERHLNDIIGGKQHESI